MTDTLRNMPRYIRNTDAFGWQGAAGPDGPWRPITPPQSGTPWQTTSAMDDLRQASAKALSLAAHAVVGAAHAVDWVNRRAIAAALRAAADQLAYVDSEDRQFIYVPELLAIAAELEGANTKESPH